jgi:hypothetical protein
VEKLTKNLTFLNNLLPVIPTIFVGASREIMSAEREERATTLFADPVGNC